MARVGYARVSTDDQHLGIQLERIGLVDKMFAEKLSGLDGARPALTACREYLREGDVLIITRIDRMARSTLDLCMIAAELERKGVELIVLDQAIDTTSSIGRLVFNILAAVAQFETEIRAERQREGIAKAKAAGAYAKSRRLADIEPSAIDAALRGGMSMQQIATRYGVSRSTVYRYLSSVNLSIHV